MAEYSQEAFEEGRAYAKAHPAPEHIVAVINRALRAPRTDRSRQKCEISLDAPTEPPS